MEIIFNGLQIADCQYISVNTSSRLNQYQWPWDCTWPMILISHGPIQHIYALWKIVLFIAFCVVFLQEHDYKYSKNRMPFKIIFQNGRKYVCFAHKLNSKD